MGVEWKLLVLCDYAHWYYVHSRKPLIPGHKEDYTSQTSHI